MRSSDVIIHVVTYVCDEWLQIVFEFESDFEARKLAERVVLCAVSQLGSGDLVTFDLCTSVDLNRTVQPTQLDSLCGVTNCNTQNP